jgi:SP family facilitated glucose transporter-like MFS transporter 3
MPRSICKPWTLGLLTDQDSAFGAAVTLLTLGGLLGTLMSDLGTRRLGRIGLLRVSELFFAIGTAFVGLANGLVPLVIGR